MSQINVVPYIDVMLVLLIIFMVTAPLLQQGVEVDLPNAPSESLPDELQREEPVVVSVNRQGEFFLNQDRRPIGEDDLADAVKALLAKEPKKPVYVRGDQQVDYGRVIMVMVILQNAGADGIGLITEPAQPQAEADQVNK